MRLSALAAAGLGLTMLAQAESAGAASDLETKAIPATAIFPFLDTYLGLPASTRDHYHLVYTLNVQGKASEVHMVLKRKSGDTALSAVAGSPLSPLPTLAELKDKTPVQITAPKGTKLGVNLKLAESLEPAKVYDAQALKTGIDQARDGTKKVAGLMSMMVPDFRIVCFEGASAGTATLNNGKSLALKSGTKPGQPAGTPCFNPWETPNAVQITLDRVPIGAFIMAK